MGGRIDRQRDGKTDEGRSNHRKKERESGWEEKGTEREGE